MAQTPNEAADPTGGYRNAPTSAPTPPPVVGPPPSDAPVFANVVVVDTSKIDMGAAGFAAAAGDAQNVVTLTRAGTQNNELGATPWGTDPLGAAFGAQYVPVAQAADQAMDALAGMLSDIADRLTTASKTFTGAEDFALGTANSLRSNN